MGGLLQSLTILLLPIRPIYALLPTFGLAIWKVTILVLKVYGVVENPLMEGVQHGRLSAVFPPSQIGEKGMFRPVGESVGGQEMCILYSQIDAITHLDCSTPSIARWAPTLKKCTKSLRKIPSETASSATQTTAPIMQARSPTLCLSCTSNPSTTSINGHIAVLLIELRGNGGMPNRKLGELIT